MKLPAMFLKSMKIRAFAQLSVCLALVTGLGGCGSAGKLSGSFSSTSDGSFSAMAQSLSAGILGTDFGNSLDSSSMKKALRAEYLALEKGRSGFPVPWIGTSGFTGKVIPQQPYQVGSTDCRRYEHILQEHGEEKRAIGTACRNAEGGWVPLK